jgi:hypothetical protein
MAQLPKRHGATGAGAQRPRQSPSHKPAHNKRAAPPARLVYKEVIETHASRRRALPRQNHHGLKRFHQRDVGKSIDDIKPAAKNR